MTEQGPPIVIVDDLSDELYLLQRIIKGCKILNPVCLFETGGDCIRFLEADSKADQPQGCILFLDLVMEPTSGLEVLENIKNLPSARKSLIVMISGLTDIKAIHQGYQLGAHTFLIKPLKSHDLLQLLEQMGNRVSVEEQDDGYRIDLVSDTDTSFIKHKQAQPKPLFANWAGRLKAEVGEPLRPEFPPSQRSPLVTPPE